MNANDALWHIFETTGSVLAYLDYKAEKKPENKEEKSFGVGGNGGNNNQRG